MDYYRQLEVDLQGLKEKVLEDEEYAFDLYSALCNNEWMKVIDDKERYVGFTWRYAGGVVAEMEGNVEPYNYMKFYCSGNEGNITDEIAADLGKLGWTPVELSPIDNFY